MEKNIDEIKRAIRQIDQKRNVAKNNGQTKLIKELSKNKIALKTLIKIINDDSIHTLESLKDRHNFETKELTKRVGQEYIDYIIKKLED